MTTCQTAANEFLRQFWSASYPPLSELPSVSTAAPAQRVAKATKMIGYLSKTHEKVQALVQSANTHSVEPARIEMVSIHYPTVK